MFSFPWHSAARMEKVLPEGASFMPVSPSITHPPLLNKMKRKREESSPKFQDQAFPCPKRRVETMSHVQISAPDCQGPAVPDQAFEKHNEDRSARPVATMSPMLNDEYTARREINHSHAGPCPGTLRSSGSRDSYDNRIRDSVLGPVRSSALRDTIEAQFGLEILLKHKELRLIDQEYAKCQVALEQLRRCHIIPYPATSSDPEALLTAGSGLGPRLSNTAPRASPWGVTDGPYTRHFQRWLIPDPAFGDSVPANVHAPTLGGKAVPNRATRGSTSELGVGGGTSRSQRGSNTARLKALPHGYAEPKEEKGPMIVKRGSDGKMVKLVCLDCRRSNFNSAQGFINHCRIAHSRQFLSHDAAIEASGEEVDVDAEGSVGELNHAAQATTSSTLVHPLIRSSGHMLRTSPTERSVTLTPNRKTSKADTSMDYSTMNAPIPSHLMSTPEEAARHSVQAPFTPSPQTPNLSALFAKINRGGDLDDMVKIAKERPRFDSAVDDEEDEEGMETTLEPTNAIQSHSTRGILRGGDTQPGHTKSPPSAANPSIPYTSLTSVQRPSYLSNINIQQAYSSHYHTDGVHDGHHPTMPHGSSPFNLSPNTTEAHTAPSLVSDDGDFDNTHSDSESPSLVGDDDDEDHYVHARVIDHDDMDLGEGSSAAHHLSLGGKPPAPAPGPRPRSSTMRPPTSMHGEEPEQRHVSFASPVRRQRRDSRTTDGK